MTLTHEDMTRFIITLNQAIDLVFKTTSEAVGGEIFVIKMAAHTVKELAEIMFFEGVFTAVANFIHLPNKIDVNEEHNET